MRHILIFLLLSAACFGQGAFVSPYRMTANLWVDTQRTLALDGVTDYFIPRWQQLQSKTLNKVLLRTSAVNGTIEVNDLVAELVQGVTTAGALAATVTYTDATDIVNLATHPFSNGDKVKFGASTSLPAGITANTTYYVCNAAANTFQVDNDSGCGSIVTDFSGSSGTQGIRWVLDETNTVTSVPTGAANVEFTGFTAALTAGNQYGIAVRNANAAPGTNYPTFATVGGAIYAGVGGLPPHSSTTNFSTSSALGNHASFDLRLEFSDASFFGSSATGTLATENVYGTAAAGTRVPASPAALKVAGVCMYTTITSTPTTNYEFRIYTGADSSESLLGTTGAFSRRNATGSMCSLFSSPVTIPKSAVYRVIVAPVSSGDSSSNRLNVTYVPIPNTSTDKALYGGLKKATCTVPCSAGGWTYTDTHIPLFYSLILVDGDEIETPASSGGGSYAFIH